MSKVLLFGSDLVSLHTLKSLIGYKPALKQRISLLGPPVPKNRRLPPYEFHKYARQQEIPFAFESNFKQPEPGTESDWSVLEKQI